LKLNLFYLLLKTQIKKINKMENTQINNDMAGNFISAMMDLNEFDLQLTYKQAKYIASIMVTMQKHSIDEILNRCKEAIEVHKISVITSAKLDELHTLICNFDEQDLDKFNPPIL
jgi:formyltetrahydrofolate hydrolase